MQSVDFDTNFGIELEFCRESSREFLSYVISRVFPDDKVEISSWQKNVDNDYWVCKPDSSCGFEISSPVFRSREDLDRFCKLVDYLKDNGARVTQKCGIHVHVECKDLNAHGIAKVLGYWVKSEPMIISMFPKHRRANRYCSPLMNDIFFELNKVYTPKQLINLNSRRKNKSLNVRGYKRRGTLEFRMLEGYLRAIDIENWILFCLYFLRNAQNYSKPKNFDPFEPDEFWRFMQFDKECDEKVDQMRRWVLRRLIRYSPIQEYKDYSKFLLTQLSLC